MDFLRLVLRKAWPDGRARLLSADGLEISADIHIICMDIVVSPILLYIHMRGPDCRQQTADSRQQTKDSRQQTADSRQQTADSKMIETVAVVLEYSWRCTHPMSRVHARDVPDAYRSMLQTLAMAAHHADSCTWCWRRG